MYISNICIYIDTFLYTQNPIYTFIYVAHTHTPPICFFCGNSAQNNKQTSPKKHHRPIGINFSRWKQEGWKYHEHTTPRKINGWNLRIITPLEVRKIIDSNPSFFRFYVNLWACTYIYLLPEPETSIELIVEKRVTFSATWGRMRLDISRKNKFFFRQDV